MPSPNILVTTRKIDDDQRAYICGALYPFMGDGTLDDQVQSTNPTTARLLLIDKARWCLQMASAIVHTHFVAHTSHMDIKPANFVVNANRDLILLDWEQSGAWQYSLAPEATDLGTSKIQGLSHRITQAQIRQRRSLSMKNTAVLTGKTFPGVDLSGTCSYTGGSFIPEP